MRGYLLGVLWAFGFLPISRIQVSPPGNIADFLAPALALITICLPSRAQAWIIRRANGRG